MNYRKEKRQVLVKFQIIHKLKEKDFIEIIKSAVKLVNDKILKEHPPYCEEEDLPISPIFTYHTEQKSCSLSGICLDLSQYAEAYYDDYDSTISMGFYWGAGAAIDEVIGYIDLYIETIKSNKNIIQIIKYEDTNLQNAYWLLTKEIYELEMSLRELINFLLFKNSNDGDICSLLKNKVKIRHSINKFFFDENQENEIFSLDFTHYQQIFESYPEIFTKSILDDIDKIRIFRNSVMHNKGYTSTKPTEFWDAKDRLFDFITNFWNSV